MFFEKVLQNFLKDFEEKFIIEEYLGKLKLKFCFVFFFYDMLVKMRSREKKVYNFRYFVVFVFV